MQKIKIFVASPSDVKKEREITRSILKKLKRKYKEYYEIEWIFWENKPLVATRSFQDGIDNPSTSELVIFILWSTLGSDLDSTYKGKITGKQPITGTEWEYEEVIAHYKIHGKPDILVYKKNDDILCSIDNRKKFNQKIKDKKKLDKFIQSQFINKDGTFKGAYHKFKESEEFENKLELHLAKWIKNRQKEKINLDTKIDERINDLKNESLATFESQKVNESLQNSKKCAELICQIISLKEEAYFDDEKYNKNPNKFIDEMTKDIPEDQDMDFLRNYLNLVICHGNYASNKNLTHEHIKISNKCLQRLLKWLYLDYLKRKMPVELTKYLSKYDILINYNNTDKEWVSTLTKNFEENNYKVFLLNGEKQKIDEYKKLNQAFSEIKVSILVCSNSIRDKIWLTKERGWIEEQQSETLESKTISIYSKKSNLKKKDFIDMSTEYKSKFSDLINKVEGTPTSIDLTKIQEPIKKSRFTSELILILIFLIGIALFIIYDYFNPDIPDIKIYTARNNKSTYNIIGKNIIENVAKDAKISMETEKSQGSYDNLEKLLKSSKNSKTLTMAIVQSDVLQEYIKDNWDTPRIENLKVLAPLHKEEFHLIVRADSNLTYFHQIIKKGVRVNVGREKSGTRISSKFLTKEMYLGLAEKVNLAHGEENDTLKDVLTRLKNNETDVVIAVAGQPLGILNDYVGLKLLTYSPKLLLKKQRELGLLKGDTNKFKNSYLELDIKPESYDWNDKNIHTLSTRAYLVVYDDGKNNQKLLKKFINSYMENLCKIKKMVDKKDIHKKWKDVPEYLEDNLPEGLSYSPIAKDIFSKSKQPIIECIHQE